MGQTRKIGRVRVGGHYTIMVVLAVDLSMALSVHQIFHSILDWDASFDS